MWGALINEKNFDYEVAIIEIYAYEMNGNVNKIVEDYVDAHTEFIWLKMEIALWNYILTLFLIMNFFRVGLKFLIELFTAHTRSKFILLKLWLFSIFFTSVCFY